MVTQTANRPCSRGRNGLFGAALGAAILSMTGCAETGAGSERGAGVGTNVSRTGENSDAAPVLRSSAGRDSIDASMRSAPEEFQATGLALWDGSQTLPGVWIAHPLARTARRVRITNNETGTRVDAAMFLRDPNLSGPQIFVSSEAAELLGLTPGHGTPIAIDGLAYRTGSEAAVRAPGPKGSPGAAPGAAAAAGAPATATLGDETGPKSRGPAPDQPGPGAVGSEGGRPSGEDNPSAAGVPPPSPQDEPEATAPAGSADIGDDRHFVQAGLFARPGNATRLVAALRAAALPVTKQPVTLGQRRLTRVLVGPYRTAAERDAALRTVRKLGPPDAAPVHG